MLKYLDTSSDNKTVRYILRVKYFYYTLMIIGVFVLVVGIYLWSQDGFIIPWGNLFEAFKSLLGSRYGAERSSGVPIPSQFFLIPLGGGTILFAWEALHMKRWESHD